MKLVDALLLMRPHHRILMSTSSKHSEPPLTISTELSFIELIL
jgi:hypothetical protein